MQRLLIRLKRNKHETQTTYRISSTSTKLGYGSSKPNPTPTVSSTGQSGGTGTANVGSVDLKGSYYYQPPTPTGGYIGQVGATQQQTATNPNSTTGSSASTNGSTYRGTSENQRESEPITVSYGGGKADGHGSSNKATVKGSSQGSTGTYYCLG